MTEPKPEYTPTNAPIVALLDDERAERERLRAELAQARAERDGLAAQCNELREALNEADYFVCDACIERFSKPDDSELYRTIQALLARTPVASLAAVKAQVWREAAGIAKRRMADLEEWAIEVDCNQRAAELEAQAGEVK